MKFDRREQNLAFLIAIAVLGAAAAIRVKIFPSRPDPVVADPMEEWAKRSAPACAGIIREENQWLKLEAANDDGAAKSYLRKERSIESSGLADAEKEIAQRRLAEESDIKDTKREANSDMAFMHFHQRLK